MDDPGKAGIDDDLIIVIVTTSVSALSSPRLDCDPTFLLPAVQRSTKVRRFLHRAVTWVHITR